MTEFTPGGSTSLNGHEKPNLVASALDSHELLDYLTRLLDVTLGAAKRDLEEHGSLLCIATVSDTLQRFNSFLNEPQLAIYIVKQSGLRLDVDGADAIVSVTYNLSSDLVINSSTLAFVTILKRPYPIASTLPLPDQLQVFNFPGLNSFNGSLDGHQNTSSHFELLYSVVHSALSPYLNALIRSQDLTISERSRPDEEQRTGIPGAKKKLAELELSLLQLQQNADIPQLYLQLHPVIQAALNTASQSGVNPSFELIPAALLEDSVFHNNLQSLVNGWIKSIQTVTKTTRDASKGSATQEINFWLDMESALKDIEIQLRSKGVLLTIDILKKAKRHQVTVSFVADTGLKESTELVQKYNQLMRGFPLDELLSAPSLDKIQASIGLIFGHLNKKLRGCLYPIRRALPLVEAISGDLDTRLHVILDGRLLMQMIYHDFQATISQTTAIWHEWDENVKEFTDVARDLTRRRNEKFIPIKISTRHTQTQDRLKYVSSFRANHEQLQQTIRNVLSPDVSLAGSDAYHPAATDDLGSVDPFEEVSKAFLAFEDVDALDVTIEGTRIWDHAETLYNECTSRVENSIIARLRDRLATAKTANGMFRVFSRFNALFIRPKIRGAISEYQTQLIDKVKKDIVALHDRFKQQYGHAQAHAMAQLHDVPPVSGAIIWARQIERQLDTYMKKVEDVLGTQWHLHTEGQKLRTENMNFRKKLDTRHVYQSWLQAVGRRNISLYGRFFNVVRNRASGNLFELDVNFDGQVIMLFKEVRNLTWLNFAIPHAINNVSKEARRIYPYAVSLVESLRMFIQTGQIIAGMADRSILLNGYRLEVYSLISKGIHFKWESFVHAHDLYSRPLPSCPDSSNDQAVGPHNDSEHGQFVREFALTTSRLQSKAATLLSISEIIRRSITHLESCPYQLDVFQGELGTIQTAVDQLSLESFANLNHWVATTNATIADILLKRLELALSVWMQMFHNFQAPEVTEISRDTVQGLQGSVHAEQYTLKFERSVHEITMRNQVISLEPPLDSARSSWIAKLHAWLGNVCNLRKLQASRYDISLRESSQRDTSIYFTELLSSAAGKLEGAYQVIERNLDHVSKYVEKWLQFQSLWDLQNEQIHEALGNELSEWLQLLQDIRKTRSTFDTTDSLRHFGILSVDYEQVQVKINAKYDLWQNDIMVQFAAKLGTHLNEVFAEIQQGRKDLEDCSLEGPSTAQAVIFITTVQNAKRKVNVWGPEVEIFRQGQIALSRQRFQFPSGWQYFERVEDEWVALNDILDRKGKIVLDQMDALNTKINAEDKLVRQRIDEIAVQWKEERPLSGTIPAKEATANIAAFESKLTQLANEFEMMSKAREALDMPPSQDTGLVALLDEVHDFTSVWTALCTIWGRLSDLRETLWTSVQPRKIRQSIENLMLISKEMPSRMRQYAAFEYLQTVTQQLLKVNPLLTELKSDNMRERHWTRIFKTLRPSTRHSQLSMTLGDVWDLQLTQGTTIIRDVIAQAQGEMALEEYLRQVKETWQGYSLDLVPYQGKCSLIRGWDDLFAKCSDTLNSLQAMRHSPHYKEFEAEASSWEEKLNRSYVLFDVWIDVQRQWIYLEGVFSDNADIKHLLPVESSRFQNLNSEFFALMKKVQRAPLVLDVVSITGVQKTLERLAELLHKIQKALGEYLERERMSFPRFYFVGDEDLLEIIGNSNDTLRIARHLGKMFAGISGLLMGGHAPAAIIGFRSAQGEEVYLKNEISLTKGVRVNEWLGALEQSMKNAIAELLAEAVEVLTLILSNATVNTTALNDYMDHFPAQIVVLAAQVWWTSSIESILNCKDASFTGLYQSHVMILRHLATLVVKVIMPVYRKKCENLITELVYQRDVIESLITNQVDSSTHHLWLLQLRYDYRSEGEFIGRLQVRMANATLTYGFEYLGVADRLVRTPLTDRCFLTMTQALCQRLGGSPYGPAGTGKTETVKALGVQLGRFTLVFCCDETFDFQAMGRIFLGICQVGAWVCFDEFNRLEERILSAVSQQVQNIQLGLKHIATDERAQVELGGRQTHVDSNTGIFITMNPGYAGRSNLPDNLKKLFRSVAMSKPDKQLIAEVTLYSQGFDQAREISRQIVPFFDACQVRLTAQPHYDFGLRAMKSVLVSSGRLKRTKLVVQDHGSTVRGEVEAQIIVQSLRETVSPKLIRNDIEQMKEIEVEVFPGVCYIPAALGNLEQALLRVTGARQMASGEDWLTKAIQLFQIQNLHHGIMLVGSSGSGKTATWTSLLQALQLLEQVEGTAYVIDPKVISKEALYGILDSTTREWTDGLFTSIIRKIIDNLRGESSKRHWIVFDGDVDPEWVENLNSLLDDNKLLTLPNGERLVLPSNVRILFEVETLKYATLATVSRCGMVWFNDDNVTVAMMVANYVGQLRSNPLQEMDEDSASGAQSSANVLEIQCEVANLLEAQFGNGTFVEDILQEATKLSHIMEYTHIRALSTLFSLLNSACRSILEFNAQHRDLPLRSDQIESFVLKRLLLAIVWSLAGDCPLLERHAFGNKVATFTTIDLPEMNGVFSLIDFEVSLPCASWSLWQDQVPSIEVNTHSITQPDIVIPTVDTLRHEDLLYSWLAEHKPLMLCGPPGSGKTMTLFAALRKLPDLEVVGLNFSSATTPDLLLKSFGQHCEYRKTLNGVILSPTQVGRWLVIFCDEINLPAPDKYGTQRVVAFLRQLIEQNGFWKTPDKTWVTLERIQFVGACNPPTDAGRKHLSRRFLRHAPLVMVDYPGETSLLQIYGTFNNAVLKVIPSLRSYSQAMTCSMVQLYTESQKRFTTQIQPHYIYSPRELTRWVRGVYESIKPLENLDLDGLIRIWTHEALRLFQDRLISNDERKWTSESIRRIALQHFPSINAERAFGGPMLFSNWLSKHYIPVEKDRLRHFVKARLKTFCDEEVDVPIVLYDDALDHILRIDRVFRQTQGHVILIGVSGSGKTTLSRFVAWMNGLKVFQIKVHGKYSSDDFDEDLRSVLRRCGCKGERICFILDESNVLNSAFLERMNTLLANAEVPGLFEGDELASLMTACKEGAQRQGLLLDSHDELYNWFTQQIVKNLHVVFTMNPPEEDLSTRAATSPALFNRCVLNWFGDWSDQALFQVGLELTQPLDLDRGDFVAPDSIPLSYRGGNLSPAHRDTVVNAMVYIHHSLNRFNKRLEKQLGKITYLTPRHFLDFVAQYSKLYNEKHDNLEEQQRHLNVGLDKLRETVEKVRDLRKNLAGKKNQLVEKDREANEKLQNMINDQRQAEQRKSASLEIQLALDKQEKAVASRREIVLTDLNNAEPAVLEAQKSVRNIKRQHLTELRSMASPPASVKLALEAVCTLLGHKVDNWKAIQTIVRRDDFIASIVNYDNENQMTPTHRTKMRHEYLLAEDFTYERVNRASKACGPLVQWVGAQVNFSEILDRVGPLREEVSVLEDQALQTKAEAQAIDNKIQELECSILVYKSEYAGLISETEAIKSEMSRVQSKVERSLHLLDSLASERKRWEEGSKSFETQIDTIVGDVLAAAAFITYGGLFDQQYRKVMLEDWLHHLSLCGIRTKPHNPVTEYLSTADERLQWQENSLPVDDLCTENAIILQRFNRYPLIIDPSGKIAEFLQNEHKGRRLTITSFLDDNFSKQVESALRFGNPILIQDAEYMDPVLNHVLNREYQKTGGRVLIHLGKQEIDFSSRFKLYLTTRNPAATFAPDVCSRTTFVNFTVTQSSLQTQSLNKVLRSERPDVDERRLNLIIMQGDFKTRLRRLESQLLQALNNSHGNILDDDAVVETLENVKKEVGVITSKMAETDGVMAEVNEMTSEYVVVAQSCSAIFAVLEHLCHVNHFYQFSLQYFVDIFDTVLRSAKSSSNQKDYKSRVDEIIKLLFATTFHRTSLTVLQRDRTTFAMLLVLAAPYKLDKTLFNALVDDNMRSGNVSTNKSDDVAVMAQVHSIPNFEAYGVSALQWNALVTEDLGENYVPPNLWNSKDPLDRGLYSLVVMKALRADRLIPATERFILEVFGKDFLDDTGDFDDLIDQVSATTPIALCCSPGFDASFRVDNVAKHRGLRCSNIAMGSIEGLGSADKAISEAASSGSWAFIKNVHLAIPWLQSLGKRLDSLKPHTDFRLFLSMECSPKIPVNLLRISRVVMCEQPAGLRANIRDSFLPSSHNATRLPVERTRLYLLLSILHGVIQERVRYAPTLGWTAPWEFNDSDYDCAVYVLDTWIDWAANSRSNLAPANVPWDMIRALIISTYGGKIDAEHDFQRLSHLVNRVFNPATFENDFDVSKAVVMEGVETSSTHEYMLPTATSWKSFEHWVNHLPEREPPSYLGLPANAEKLLLVEQGKSMTRNLGRVMKILDESEQTMAEA